jgi:hypothetical protein
MNGIFRGEPVPMKEIPVDIAVDRCRQEVDLTGNQGAGLQVRRAGFKMVQRILERFQGRYIHIRGASGSLLLRVAST